MNLHETVWTIGIYYGLNKVAALYKVSLEEARPFLQRDLECSRPGAFTTISTDNITSAIKFYL
jgi:hypothetical protein